MSHGRSLHLRPPVGLWSAGLITSGLLAPAALLKTLQSKPHCSRRPSTPTWERLRDDYPYFEL